MKKILLLVFISFTCYTGVYAQLMFGSKIGYNRYIDPGMNGATLNVFVEAPYGASDSYSIRSGIFGTLPMKYTDSDISPKNLMVNIPTDLVYDPFKPGLDVHTRFNDFGVFSEFSYFPFDGDPSENDFYITLRFSLSYSSLKRWSDDPVTDEMLTANPKLRSKSKLSYGFGGGFGYQFHMGRNTLLFSELMAGLPFVSMYDSLLSSQLTGFPLFYFSANAGFRYLLFQ